MRLFRFLRQHPVAVFGAVACAFAAWVGWEAFDNGPPPQVVTSPPGEFVARPKRFLPPPDAERSKHTAQVVQKLKPGMTRTEVENLVGAPAPTDIHPATVSGGRVTYYTAYDADLEPPPTVRPLAPIGRLGVGSKDRARPARTLVTLEFDATKPGHPLLEVHYPDPLF